MLPEDGRRSFGRKPGSLDERESNLETRACSYAKKLGYWHRKFKSPGKRSAPDRVFKHPHGDVFWIEFKAFDKGATDLQKEEHAEMRAAGLTVYVCDNFEAAKAILDRHSL